MTPWNENYVIAALNFVRVRRQSRLHLPANTVARYRLAVLFANRKAKLRLLAVGLAVEHDEIFVGDAVRVLVHVVVLIVFFKSVLRLQS